MTNHPICYRAIWCRPYVVRPSVCH